MLQGFIGGLIIAWILVFFQVDQLIITAIQETFNLTISIAQYYIGFGIIGLVGGLLGN